MKIPIFSKTAEKVGDVNLPVQFSEAVRPDLIKRAVEAIWGNNRQPYGPNPRAGKGYSATLSRRRRKYRGSYGHGISRVPRKIMTRRGTQMNWVGAFASSTVGGYRTHPPKVEKDWGRKINTKERRKAIRSALAASINKDLVGVRNHQLPKEYPFALAKDLEKLSKTKDIDVLFKKLGMDAELERAAKKNARPGKGKLRGRPYQRRKGPLIVVSGTCALQKAARNIPGVDVTTVSRLNAEALAPGTMPGRFTIFTEEALTKLTEKKLYI